MPLKHMPRYCLFAAAIIFYLPVAAQNMTSPYSVYGIGIIDFRSHNRASGMGHAGLALKYPNWLVTNNPASLAALEKSWYIMDLAFTGNFVEYAGDPITINNRSARDFGARRGALAVKITNRWASSVGFRQVSNVNYTYQGSVSTEGSPDKYAVDYEGDGGLHTFYWTNALSISKRLQAGFTMNLINGSVNRWERMEDINISRVIETKVQDYYSGLHLEYGMLYSLPLHKQWVLAIGGKLGQKTSLHPERTLTVLENGVAFVDEARVDAAGFQLPLSYGGGIALTHYNKQNRDNILTIAFDYNAERWKPLQIRGSGWSMVNSQRFSGGVESARYQRKQGRLLLRRLLQFGGFVNNSNLSVKSNQLTDAGITVGFGSTISTIAGDLLYNLALEVGQQGTTRDGLIKENYVRITLGIGFRDFLYSKGRKYY
jgi:hypothetical protein